MCKLEINLTINGILNSVNVFCYLIISKLNAHLFMFEEVNDMNHTSIVRILSSLPDVTY